MLRLALLAGVAAFTISAAQAGVVIDEAADPQLFVGLPGTTSPPGGTAIGGESNLIGADMSFGVAGNHVMQSPLLVLFASPVSALITLSSSACGGLCGLANPGTYALATNSALLFPGATVYESVGLASGGSESYGNYVTAAGLNSLPAPAGGLPYHVTVFQLPGQLNGSTIFTAHEDGAPAGTFVSLFSCEVGATTTVPCTPPGAIGSTPFTNSGLITPDPTPRDAPEPMTLALMGVGLLGLGFTRRR